VSREALIAEAHRRGLLRAPAVQKILKKRRKPKKQPHEVMSEAISAASTHSAELGKALLAAIQSQKPSSVTVAAPVVRVDAAKEPVINVEAVINVPPAEVTVESDPRPRKWTMLVNRDEFGNLESVTAIAE
jgi:hypothetical protein